MALLERGALTTAFIYYFCRAHTNINGMWLSTQIKRQLRMVTMWKYVTLVAHYCSYKTMIESAPISMFAHCVELKIAHNHQESENEIVAWMNERRIPACYDVVTEKRPALASKGRLHDAIHVVNEFTRFYFVKASDAVMFKLRFLDLCKNG